VNARAQAHELVREPVERAVKARDEHARRARLARRRHGVERHAVDVREHAPHARALARAQVGARDERRARARRHEARRLDPLRREPGRDGRDVLVNAR
jgi:hypothetical protein